MAPLHWICVVIFCLIRVSSATFTCFPNETNKVTFNNSTKVVQLPTIRLIQGFYSSQWVMQYAAYVYLKEKVGLNVTMYPKDDPNALMMLLTNQSLTPSYPQFYYAWIAQDKYDMLFEIWDIMESDANGINYYTNNSVLDGGLTDVIGISGLFVPTYVFKDNPHWIDQESMRTNDSIRQMYIDAATMHTDRDWVAYVQGLEEMFNSYDNATYDKPIAFGSFPNYVYSQVTNAALHKVLDDTWNFVTLGSETLLGDFIVDMYQKRLPFVAAMYSPHRDFATIINQTTREIMTFEPLRFGKNSSNIAYDLCVQKGVCSQPVMYDIKKIGNPLLYDRFPEMLDFLSRYTMEVDDVNEILGIHFDIVTNTNSIYHEPTKNLTEHEIWQFAACEWLKSSVGINSTQEWGVDIVRYDCDYGTSLTECMEQSTTNEPTHTPTNTPTNAPTESESECECDLNYDPVCCDGREYGNECLAHCEGKTDCEACSFSETGTTQTFVSGVVPASNPAITNTFLLTILNILFACV